MEAFLLSKNFNFPFKIFGIQHIFTIILTIILLFLLYKYRVKIVSYSHNNLKKQRIIMLLIILGNMLIYRFSYMFYGVYNIKSHLSLYFCHIVNYLFILSLILNYKTFYKIIYGLSWIGPFFAVIFPSLSVGIDCFGFYTFFISHNLLLVFVTYIMIATKIKYCFNDFFKCMLYSISIILFTYFINYDFGTYFNTPNSILGNYMNLDKLQGYLVLFVISVIGNFLAIIINRIYIKNYNRKENNILVNC